jgi:hypothetical protein
MRANQRSETSAAIERSDDRAPAVDPKSFPRARPRPTLTIRSTEERDRMLALLSLTMLGMAAAGGGGSRLVRLHDPMHPDLPCPWCRTQTSEEDTACVGCGHRFG